MGFQGEHLETGRRKERDEEGHLRGKLKKSLVPCACDGAVSWGRSQREGLAFHNLLGRLTNHNLLGRSLESPGWTRLRGPLSPSSSSSEEALMVLTPKQLVTPAIERRCTPSTVWTSHRNTSGLCHSLQAVGWQQTPPYKFNTRRLNLLIFSLHLSMCVLLSSYPSP